MEGLRAQSRVIIRYANIITTSMLRARRPRQFICAIDAQKVFSAAVAL